jgi:hypothetical protein
MWSLTPSTVDTENSACIDLKIDRILLWTDSTIVLSWLATSASKWKTFVANRVAQIQELTAGCEWRHVASASNPADLIS